MHRRSLAEDCDGMYERTDLISKINDRVIALQSKPIGDRSLNGGGNDIDGNDRMCVIGDFGPRTE